MTRVPAPMVSAWVNSRLRHYSDSFRDCHEAEHSPLHWPAGLLVHFLEIYSRAVGTRKLRSSLLRIAWQHTGLSLGENSCRGRGLQASAGVRPGMRPARDFISIMASDLPQPRVFSHGKSMTVTGDTSEFLLWPYSVTTVDELTYKRGAQHTYIYRLDARRFFYFYMLSASNALMISSE